MVFDLKINSISELADLQQLAFHADKPVYIANKDGTIRVDARSFLGLFALDYSKPMKVVTDSLYVVRMLEIKRRAQDASSSRLSRKHKNPPAQRSCAGGLLYSLISSRSSGSNWTPSKTGVPSSRV